MRSLLLFLLLGGVAFADEAKQNHDLANLVHQDCGSCHGLRLKGGLGPPLLPDAIPHYDVETLSEVILDGIPGTAMPPWRPLMTEAEARWIAQYLLQRPN